MVEEQEWKLTKRQVMIDAQSSLNVISEVQLSIVTVLSSSILAVHKYHTIVEGRHTIYVDS